MPEKREYSSEFGHPTENPEVRSATRRSMKAFKNLMEKVLLVVTAVVVSLLVFEGALRLIGYCYTPLRIETINTWSEWRYYHAFDDAKFVYDPELIWRPRKGSGGFNKQGFRGKLLTPVREV